MEKHPQYSLHFENLRDIICEWYILNCKKFSSHLEFIKTHHLDDIITRQDFSNLLEGKACLPQKAVPTLAKLISIPDMSVQKLKELNLASKRQKAEIINMTYEQIEAFEFNVSSDKKLLKKIQANRHYIKNTEQIRNKNKIWNDNNPEKISAYKQSYKERNREKVLEKERIRKNKTDAIKRNKQKTLALLGIMQNIINHKEKHGTEIAKQELSKEEANRQRKNQNNRNYHQNLKLRESLCPEMLQLRRIKNAESARKYRTKQRLLTPSR